MEIDGMMAPRTRSLREGAFTNFSLSWKFGPFAHLELVYN